MNGKTLRENTRLFLLFLLAAGVANLCSRSGVSVLDVLFACTSYTFYIGLLLFWIQSVRARLLPSRSRDCVVLSGQLLLAFLTVRDFAYMCTNDLLLIRYAIYFYFVPMILIPTLFLVTCIRILRREGDDGKGREAWLFLPAGALSVMTMTNDLHFLVYRPHVPLPVFEVVTGTYSYGIGVYLIYVWMIGMAVLGLVMLLRETRRRSRGVFAMLLTIVAVWFGLVLLTLLVADPLDIPRMYNIPETHIFGMLGMMEVIIRSRLIPCNENHAGFFAQLGLPALITDRELTPVYRTNLAVNALPDQLTASLNAPVYPTENLRLSGMAIRAGYAFWAEDETELREENRRLASVNEILIQENDLIAVENRLKEQKAHLDAQNQVYDRIAAALYPRQRQIRQILENTRPGEEGFSRALGHVCVLNAYSKRKSNLLLLSGEGLPRRNRELFLALQESARFLRCCGVEAAAIGEEYAAFPLSDIHDLYDAFEAVIEAVLPCLRRMTVSLTADGFRLAMEISRPLALPAIPLPMETLESDDCTFLTVRRKGGIDA